MVAVESVPSVISTPSPESVPAASIVAEGMLSFALADALLDKFGGDSMKQFKAHLDLSGKY